MLYEVIRMQWAKRRKATPIREVKQVSVSDFKEKLYHSTPMTIIYEDGEQLVLKGQVGYNEIKEYWTVNGIDGKGNQVSVKAIPV